MPRKPKYTMGLYNPTKDETEAMLWCIDRHIKISPVAKGNGTWYVDIQTGHKKAHRSPKSFGPVEIWEVIYNYYNHYYEKKKGIQ